MFFYVQIQTKQKQSNLIFIGLNIDFMSFKYETQTKSLYFIIISFISHYTVLTKQICSIHESLYINFLIRVKILVLMV